MSILSKFLIWVQSLFSGDQPTPPPPIFSKETTTFFWREGTFTCQGILPNNTRPYYFYTLEVKPVRAIRSTTSYEIRCKNENAYSRVPTHAFILSYQRASVVEGKAVTSSKGFTFRIEVSCWLPKKSSTDSGWNAVMKIAPQIRDEIIAICKESNEEDVYRVKGVRLQPGQTLASINLTKCGTQVNTTKQYNKRKLLLLPFPSQINNESEKQWKKFIEERIKELEKEN